MTRSAKREVRERNRAVRPDSTAAALPEALKLEEERHRRSAWLPRPLFFVRPPSTQLDSYSLTHTHRPLHGPRSHHRSEESTGEGAVPFVSLHGRLPFPKATLLTCTAAQLILTRPSAGSFPLWRGLPRTTSRGPAPCSRAARRR